MSIRHLEMNTRGYRGEVGVPFGAAGSQSQSSSAIPSLCGAETEGEEGGAADQKDQSQLKVRIKTQLLL